MVVAIYEPKMCTLGVKKDADYTTHFSHPPTVYIQFILGIIYFHARASTNQSNKIATHDLLEPIRIL